MSLSLVLAALATPVHSAPPPLPRATPAEAGMRADRLAPIDAIVADGLRRGRMPGCVVMIGRRGKVVFHKAYGHRQLKPRKLPMTTDTVFDLASLTKPIATATSVMKLLEAGRVRLDDPVAKHLPEFAANGKQKVTILQLLTHQGGLIPDNALADYREGRDEAFRRIYALKPYVPPGTRFVYTDVGFIVLAEIVRKLTGKNVHQFSQENFFQPLGMKETGYLPAEPLRKRAATTEQREGRWMQGEVHDPRAHLLGGIAGHAGLFSTTDDLARFAQMLLGRGQYQSVRVLKQETVKRMTTPVRVSSGLRGLGWDIRTGYSSNRGDLFSQRAFGHGGFTGTTLWVDPGLDLFVIFLSNRVHPSGRGSVNALAGRIGTLAAAAITDADAPEPTDKTNKKPTPKKGPRESSAVQTGIDVLVAEKFRRLKGRKVGLITNHTGIDRRGISTVKLLHEADGVKLVALFSPEHGFAGKLDVARISDSKDQSTGLKIFSLYGKTRTPTEESLKGIDTLVFDIQDIGTRFYTYISTMGNAMRAAARHKLRFVVLDRPNPIGGVEVQGPVLDAGRESFVGFHTLPVRHGMTIGELAQMFNQEFKLGLDLHVVRLRGWRRTDFFDRTGLLWVNPSPNMRNLNQALLYPGIGLIETTNVSVGRGTDTPFELVGAPWVDAQRLAASMNGADLPGVRFVPTRFTPDSSKHRGAECGGIQLLITDRQRVHPLRIGLTLAGTLRQQYPDQWKTAALPRLLCDQNTQEAILKGLPFEAMQRQYAAELRAFQERRKQFLLYR